MQTLPDRYPFGTLLVYPENDNDKDAKLQLLDGSSVYLLLRSIGKIHCSFGTVEQGIVYKRLSVCKEDVAGRG